MHNHSMNDYKGRNNQRIKAYIDKLSKSNESSLKSWVVR